MKGTGFMTETDGIDEAVEGLSRTGLAVAARLGEQLVRMREQELRDQQAADEQRARELEARFEAQRAAARAQLAPTADSRWWDQARSADIERVHETATAWKQFDPAAHEAAERIQREVQQRYGIDVNNPGADERAISEALAQAERDRTEADRQRAAGERHGTEAAALLAEAGREDQRRAAEAATLNTAAREAGALYDSEERRQSFAASLDGKADAETIGARILADRDQATPPAAAVTTAPRKPPAPKRSASAERPRNTERETSR